MLGQAFIDLYQHWGMTQIIASTLSSMTLVFLAALLTGLNVFHKIAKHAGAGTLVPITGFSNAVTCAAMEFKSEERVIIDFEGREEPHITFYSEEAINSESK